MNLDDFSMVELVQRIQPKLMVELGTGDGDTSSRVMEVLRKDAILITINWPNPPSGDNPMKYLAPWISDPRLAIIYSDTREQAEEFADGCIDLLYIDSTHTCECATKECNAYRPKMRSGATVVVDDLDQNDMRKFWDALPYEKTEFRNGCRGMFRYEPAQ